MPNFQSDFLEFLEEGKWQEEMHEQAEQVIFCHNFCHLTSEIISY